MSLGKTKEGVFCTSAIWISDRSTQGKLSIFTWIVSYHQENSKKQICTKTVKLQLAIWVFGALRQSSLSHSTVTAPKEVMNRASIDFITCGSASYFGDEDISDSTLPSRNVNFGSHFIFPSLFHKKEDLNTGQSRHSPNDRNYSVDMSTPAPKNERDNKRRTSRSQNNSTKDNVSNNSDHFILIRHRKPVARQEPEPVIKVGTSSISSSPPLRTIHFRRLDEWHVRCLNDTALAADAEEDENERGHRHKTPL